MSSCPIEPTSTTASSPTCRSRPETPLAVIACGAIAAEVRLEATRSGVPVEVHALPPLLHNRPAAIPAAVGELATQLLRAGRRVVVAYADCGTYGVLDELCSGLGIERLAGLHCYDMIAGEAAIRDLLESEPGTYLVTDFLLKSFRRLVVRELGLDRYPELVPDYFGHYRRLVWLQQRSTPELEAEASFAADLLGLTLEIRPVEACHLAASLSALIGAGG